MSTKQLSVFVENRPGKLNELTEVLARNSINMRAISLAETEGFGIVRILVDDVYDAATIVRDAGYINTLTDVIIVRVPNVPGGLNEILRILTAFDINLDYMYSMSVDSDDNRSYMVLKVNDVKKAEQALEGADIEIISDET